MSDTQLQQLDRDELEQRVRELEEMVDEINLWRDAISAWKSNATQDMYDVQDDIDELRADVQDLRDDLESVRSRSDQAMQVAAGNINGDELSQTEMVKVVTRDELVRQTAMARNEELPIKLRVADVKDLVDREYGRTPAWTVVMRGWEQLASEWLAIEVGSLRGDNAAVLERQHIGKSLIAAVEESLGRDDLAKRFVGDDTEGGGAE